MTHVLINCVLEYKDVDNSSFNYRPYYIDSMNGTYFTVIICKLRSFSSSLIGTSRIIYVKSHGIKVDFFEVSKILSNVSKE